MTEDPLASYPARRGKVLRLGKGVGRPSNHCGHESTLPGQCMVASVSALVAYRERAIFTQDVYSLTAGHAPLGLVIGIVHGPQINEAVPNSN